MTGRSLSTRRRRRRQRERSERKGGGRWPTTSRLPVTVRVTDSGRQRSRPGLAWSAALTDLAAEKSCRRKLTESACGNRRPGQ